MSWNLGSFGLSRALDLKVSSCPSNDFVFTNCVFVNPADFENVTNLVRIADKYVYVVSKHERVQKSSVGFNSIQRRELRLALGDTVSISPFKWPKNQPMRVVAATFEVDLVSKKGGFHEFNAEDLTKHCQRCLQNHVPTSGQCYVLDFYGTSLLLKTATLMSSDETIETGLLTSATEFFFSKAPGASVKIEGSASQQKEIFRPDFDFEKMGIGGLEREFSDIFRRAFASRVVPTAMVQKLGMQHVKGMLLYGPPGTGKTLIARQIGKMLNGKEPKVVNGPEVLNKFVGQSEENVRNLFLDAEKDFQENGDGAELHIIIFDEIDAICKQRGMTNSSSGVGDTVVNQLLSKIDGVNSLNNILVIGMTNRKDMIDEALLRPGRLEVHVEISLPDEEGRQQILRIHTAKMRENKMLEDNVSLESIASQTKNYSGAELEGVCKSAASFALNRHVDYQDVRKKVDMSKMKVTMGDFQKALVEVQPAFGMGKDDFARCLLGGFFIHGDRMQQALQSGKLFRDAVVTSGGSPLLSVLIEGPSGTGKTALAALLAVDSGFPFVRFVSPEQYVGYSEVAKCQALAKLFDDAQKSSLSVVVLDDIERMIEFSPIGPRYSNLILQTLIVLTKRIPEKERRLLLIGTTSCADVLERLDYRKVFSTELSMHPLNADEITSILDGTAETVTLSEGADGDFATLQASGSIKVSFESAADRQRTIAMLENSVIGIKKLLTILGMARTEGPDGRYLLPTDRLRVVLNQAI